MISGKKNLVVKQIQTHTIIYCKRVAQIFLQNRRFYKGNTYK